MQIFPMFRYLAGRDVVFVGGNEEIARKVRLIQRSEARVRICTPEIPVPEIMDLVQAGRVQHVPRWPDQESFSNCALAFISTGDEGRGAHLAGLARAAGALVNVIDRPALCTAFTPSIAGRGPLVLALGPEGMAPVRAPGTRGRIAAMLERGRGALARLAGESREPVERQVPQPGRRRLRERALSETSRRLPAAEDKVAAKARHRGASAGATEGTGGSIALVGAGPGAADLLTLRALRHLQEADAIFYDRLVDPAVPALARRDAARIFVGKAVGNHSWPQEKIDRAITEAALSGQRVVRLKSGDPAIFGRATEELAAARAAGIPVSIVPGVTAASAAAASLGRALTERGETEALVLVTGTCRPGDTDPAWGALARAGTTLALYMAVGKQTRIRKALLDAGVPPDAEVEIVGSASTGRERIHRLSLCDLGIRGKEIPAPAIVLVRHPKARQGMARVALRRVG